MKPTLGHLEKKSSLENFRLNHNHASCRGYVKEQVIIEQPF